MAIHVIIGKGNLGCDLEIELRAVKGNQVFMLSPSAGFQWPRDHQKLMDLSPDVVWVTAGSGSVEKAHTHDGLQSTIETHTYLPISLALSLPNKVGLVVFSSDYAASEADPGNPARHNQRARSLYACSKVWMEHGLITLKRSKTAIVRVGSLYGIHFPDRTFPGKIIMKYPHPCEVQLPANLIAPTPTDWAAGIAAKNMDKLFSSEGTTVHHLAPFGNTNITGFAKRILGKDYNIVSKGFDQMRPQFSSLGCSLTNVKSPWHDLWDARARQFRSALSLESAGP